MEINEFENLIKELKEQRAVIDEYKARYTEQCQKGEDIEARIMEVLKEEGKTSYPSEHGTVTISHRESYKTPKTPAEKSLFFQYLRDKGVFEEMVSVNSQTLNSFCKRELEIAVESGNALDFKIPGIGEPVVNEYLSFRKK